MPLCRGILNTACTRHPAPGYGVYRALPLVAVVPDTEAATSWSCQTLAREPFTAREHDLRFHAPATCAASATGA